MTKRLTLVGLAAVAVVWGPFVYAELVRRPVEPTSTESRAIEAAEPVQVTPVAFAPAPAAEHAQPQAEPAATPTEPAAEPPPSAHAEPEPAVHAAEAEQPAAPVAQPSQPAAEPAQPEAPAAHAEPPQPAPAAEAKAEPAPAEQPAEKPAAPAEAADPAAATAQAEALAPAFRSTFDREARDAQWAEHEEPRLTQLLASSGLPSSAIGEVRCQSTVCRVSFKSGDVDNINPAQLAQLVQRVREEFGPSLALDSAKREGDSVAAFYVLRKGYELGRSRDSL